MLRQSLRARCAVLVLTMLNTVGARADDSAPASAAPAIQPIEQSFLMTFLAGGDNFTLVDARSPEEYAGGHIARAINVPHDDVDAFADALPESRDATLVVYCKTGRRAGELRAALVARGYEDVRVLGPQQIFWTDTAPIFNCGVPVEPDSESSFLPSNTSGIADEVSQ